MHMFYPISSTIIIECFGWTLRITEENACQLLDVIVVNSSYPSVIPFQIVSLIIFHLLDLQPSVGVKYLINK